jgi:ketosteroid isomerase-like protein
VTAGELVRRLYEAFDRRDWDAAAAVLHTDAVVEMQATAERLAGRDGVIAFQRAYPEPWGELRVLRMLEDGDEAVAEVEVVATGATFRLAALWRVADGLLRHGVEYWVTVGGEEPSPGRERAPG